MRRFDGALRPEVSHVRIVVPAKRDARLREGGGGDRHGTEPTPHGVRRQRPRFSGARGQPKRTAVPEADTMSMLPEPLWMFS